MTYNFQFIRSPLMTITLSFLIISIDRILTNSTTSKTLIQLI